MASKKKGSVGTWKGSGQKSDANANAVCQSYARKMDAIYREFRQLCKLKVVSIFDESLNACLRWGAASRGKEIDRNLGAVREMRAKCARR